MFSIDLHYSFYVSCGNNNEAAKELQIGPNSIKKKQEWDSPLNAIFNHFLAPEGGHPTWEDHFIEKYQTARSFSF